MTDLKRTLLRHRMLHAVATGRVDRVPHGVRIWEIRSSVSTYGLMAATVEHLIGGGAAQIGRPGTQVHGRPVIATAKGREVLAEWDTAYGAINL